MMKYIISAAILSLVAITPASAMTSAPGAKQVAPATSSAVIDVQYKGNSKHYKGDRRNWNKYRKTNRRYKAGSRHTHAPRGWHRHSKRPSDWNRRGCVIVGPVWFCP